MTTTEVTTVPDLPTAVLATRVPFGGRITFSKAFKMAQDGIVFRKLEPEQKRQIIDALFMTQEDLSRRQNKLHHKVFKTHKYLSGRENGFHEGSEGAKFNDPFLRLVNSKKVLTESENVVQLRERVSVVTQFVFA